MPLFNTKPHQSSSTDQGQDRHQPDDDFEYEDDLDDITEDEEQVILEEIITTIVHI